MPVSRRRTLLVVLGWLASRVPLYLMTTGHLFAWYGRKSIMDIIVYLRWVDGSLKHGALPIDHSWQYPPLVGPLLLLPKLLPGADYQGQFVRLAFIADAVVMIILTLTARRRGSWLGPWFWVLSVPLLGPLIYGRFDVFSAVFVVAALALMGKGVPVADGPGRDLNGRRGAAGALIGLGAAIKVWPGLTLFGVPRNRRGVQAVVAAVLAAGAATGVCMLAFKNGTYFLHSQSNRGIEIESVWAIPFMMAKRAHLWHGTIHGHYGSLEVLGAGVRVAGDVALLSTVVAFALMAWWWWHKEWRPAVVADATLVATLMMIVTSRVISPQYEIWLLATSAFCLLSKDTSQRRSTLLVLITLPLTQWVFPYNFSALIYDHTGPVLVVAVRDLLLVAATVLGFRDLWRSSVTGPFLPWRRFGAGARTQAAATEPTGPEAGAGGKSGDSESFDGDSHIPATTIA